MTDLNVRFVTGRANQEMNAENANANIGFLCDINRNLSRINENNHFFFLYKLSNIIITVLKNNFEIKKNIIF